MNNYMRFVAASMVCFVNLELLTMRYFGVNCVVLRDS
jgi:hypothetical protein